MSSDSHPTQSKRAQFYAVVWCPDCNGVDFAGCFDGGVDRLGPFETRNEAERAGTEAVIAAVWKYDIEEVE